MKNKFSILAVKELMNELSYETIFSKIDLRPDYHQMKMHDDYAKKTTFRSHHEHLEFLVILVGSTTAPSSFQGLMNYIFKADLRKFVLVFFDDILIYSQCLDQYLGHLAIVILVMRQHTLFAKKSKCFFSISQVEYLIETFNLF